MKQLLDNQINQYIYDQIKEFTQEQISTTIKHFSACSIKLDNAGKQEEADMMELGISCICLVRSLIEREREMVAGATLLPTRA